MTLTSKQWAFLADFFNANEDGIIAFSLAVCFVYVDLELKRLKEN